MPSRVSAELPISEALDMSHTTPCGVCGVPVPYQGHGRPRRYCSPEHKQELRRVRSVEVYYFKHDLRRYRLSEADYHAMLERQKGRCAICRATAPGGCSKGRWFIDHDHACCPQKRGCCGKCVRGLLCSSCNFGIGSLQDNPELLRAAAVYIERGQRQPLW